MVQPSGRAQGGMASAGDIGFQPVQSPESEAVANGRRVGGPRRLPANQIPGADRTRNTGPLGGRPTVSRREE